MDEREALYAAARRYCFGRSPALQPIFRDKLYRDREVLQAMNRETRIAIEGTVAQFDVMAGILRRIEAVDPTSFPSVEALRAYLMETA